MGCHSSIHSLIHSLIGIHTHTHSPSIYWVPSVCLVLYLQHGLLALCPIGSILLMANTTQVFSWVGPELVNTGG